MFGLQTFLPNEDFDENFNTLVVFQEFIYPAGLTWADYYSYNFNTTDYIYARPLSETPNNHRIVLGTYDPATGEPGPYGEAKMVYCTDSANNYQGLRVVVARASKTLNRKFVNKWGMEASDSSNKTVFSSNERYVNFLARGYGYGASAGAFNGIACAKNTYIDVNVMARSQHYVTGVGEDGGVFYNYAPAFQSNSTVNLLPNFVSRFAGYAYPENMLGSWMLVSI